MNGIYTATDGSFQVNPPAGWTMQDNPSAILFVAPDYTTTGANMNVTVSMPNSEILYMSMDIFEQQMNGLLNANVQCDALRPLTINGHSAVFVSYSATVYDVPMYFFQYIVVTMHHSYTLTYTVLTTPSGAEENTFAVSAKSFKEL